MDEQEQTELLKRSAMLADKLDWSPRAKLAFLLGIRIGLGIDSLETIGKILIKEP